MSRTVIVGASVAGVRTALALRSFGYEGRISLVSDEEDEPYDKPPLSKAVLSGAADEATVLLLTKQQATEKDIELVLGSAALRLDLPRRRVALASGVELEFDHLVIATGARARPSPWGEFEHVHKLRTLDDCRAVRSRLAAASSVAVIGAGFIGAEVAATARQLGKEVTMVDPQVLPMARVMGDGVGRRFIDLHADHGVVTRFGIGVRSVVSDGAGVTIVLDDGAAVQVDLAVIGIGSVPNDEWLRGTDLRVGDGVVCTSVGRVVGAEAVFAVGDVSAWRDPDTGIASRIEHWTNAVEQAQVVARAIVGPLDPPPHSANRFVWSEQYDWKIQSAGRTAGAGTCEVLESAEESGRFAAIYADADGILLGGVAVNWPRALLAVRRGLPVGAQAAAVIQAIQRVEHTKEYAK